MFKSHTALNLQGNDYA